MPADLPAFEVRDPTTGHAFRMWADGRIEGFPMGDGGSVVINRIPQQAGRQIEVAAKS